MLFARWPYPLLLLVLAVAAVDNQAFELATAIGGGAAVVLGGRRALRTPVVLALGTLLVLALRDLPLHPALTDGARPRSSTSRASAGPTWARRPTRWWPGGGWPSCSWRSPWARG